jgi:hypothetical protein
LSGLLSQPQPLLPDDIPPSTKYARLFHRSGPFPWSLARQHGRLDVGRAAFQAAHDFVVIFAF